MSNIKTILITFLCSIILGVAINISVNPFSLYGEKSIGTPSIHNDRLSKSILYLEKYSDSEILLFGSSNSMRFYPEWYEEYFGWKTFNFAFFQANVEDYFATLNFVLNKNKKKLKLVVFNLDDWNFAEFTPNSFNILDPANNRLASVPYLAKYLEVYNSFYPIYRFKTAISLDQLSASCQNLINNRIKTEYITYSTAFFSNGVRKKYLDREGNDITKIAEAGQYDISNYLNQTHEKIKSFPGFDKLESQEYFTDFSSSRQILFEKLLMQLNQNQIKVVLNLMPIQPFEQKIVEKETNYLERMIKMRNWLKELKKINGNIILIQDNSKIENFDGLENHFFDAIHPTSINSKKMFYSIINNLPEGAIQ